MNTNKRKIKNKSDLYINLEDEILELLQEEVVYICKKYRVGFLIIYKKYDKKRTVLFINNVTGMHRLDNANNQIIEILNKIPVQLIHKLKEIKQLIIK